MNRFTGQVSVGTDSGDPPRMVQVRVGGIVRGITVEAIAQFSNHDEIDLFVTQLRARADEIWVREPATGQGVTVVQLGQIYQVSFNNVAVLAYADEVHANKAATLLRGCMGRPGAELPQAVIQVSAEMSKE